MDFRPTNNSYTIFESTLFDGVPLQLHEPKTHNWPLHSDGSCKWAASSLKSSHFNCFALPEDEAKLFWDYIDSFGSLKVKEHSLHDPINKMVDEILENSKSMLDDVQGMLWLFPSCVVTVMYLLSCRF